MAGTTLSKIPTTVLKLWFFVGLVLLSVTSAEAQTTTPGQSVVLGDNRTAAERERESDRATCDSYNTRITESSSNLASACSGTDYSACIRRATSCSRDMDIADGSYSEAGQTCEDVVPDGCPSAAGRLYEGYRDDESSFRDEKNDLQTQIDDLEDQQRDTQAEQLEEMQEFQRAVTEKRQEQQSAISDMMKRIGEMEEEKVGRIQKLRSDYLQIDADYVALDSRLTERQRALRDRKIGIESQCDTEAFRARDALKAARNQAKVANSGAAGTGVIVNRTQNQSTGSRSKRKKDFAQVRLECLRRSQTALNAIEQDMKKEVEFALKETALIEQKRAILVRNLEEVEQIMARRKNEMQSSVTQAIQQQEQQMQQMKTQFEQTLAMKQQNMQQSEMRLQRKREELQIATREYEGAKRLARCTRRYSGDYEERLKDARDAQLNVGKVRSDCQLFEGRSCATLLSMTVPTVCRDIATVGTSTRRSSRTTRVEGAAAPAPAPAPAPTTGQ